MRSNVNRKRATTALGNALRSLRRLYCLIGVFSFFINVLMLVGPLYMLQVYDRVLTSRSSETLIALTLLAVGLIGLNSVLELVRSRLLARLGARFDRQLNDGVFQALFEHQLRNRSADAAHYLRDMDNFRNFVSSPAVIAFFDVPWTPAFLLLIFLFHPWLGMVALCGALVLFGVAVVSEFATRGALRRATAASSQAQEFTNAALRNVEAIRAMGMLPRVRDRWLALHSSGLAFHGRASDRAGNLTMIAKFVRPCLQIALLGVGAYLVLLDLISSGVMIAASIIMGRALAPVEQIIGNWRQFISARGAHSRLHKLLIDINQDTDKMSLPRPSGLLRVENAVVMPPGGGKPVIRGVSFELRPGQVLGVIGSSGAGKTCLARMLVGVWPLASGHVRLDGADYTAWLADELGQYIGYLPQDVELLSGTVAENIARLHELDRAKVLAASEICGAHQMILELPEGYDTQIGESGSVLSAGQRQRIGLARALYGDPCLIVLDEPNANLDSDGERALQAALERLKQCGTTVVVISHRPAVMNVVDSLLVMRAGQVEAFGPRDEILPRLMSGVRSISRPSIEKSVQSHAKAGS